MLRFVSGNEAPELIHLWVGAADQRVVAVGETAEGDGAVQWECELPAAPTTPAIADTDGDGLAEIIVMGDDGVVYCLDR